MMAFTSLLNTQNHSDKAFAVVKQHLLNTVGHTREYCISDANNVTPYHFTCPVCHDSVTHIDCSDAKCIENIKVNIDWEAIKALGGTGVIGKLMSCDHCHTPYFIGIGYVEPNYGRDVFLLHSIIELEAL